MKDDYYIIYEGNEDDAEHVFEAVAPTPSSEEPEHVIAARERRRRTLEARERRRLERLAQKEDKQRALDSYAKARETEYQERVHEYQAKHGAELKEPLVITKKTVTGVLTAGALTTVLALILFAVLYPSAWYSTASAAKGAMSYVIYVLFGLGVVLLIAGDLLALNVRRSAD